MNRFGTLAVVAAVVLPACGGQTHSVTTGGFKGEHLVECRVLGGKSVFVRYDDGEGGSTQTVRRGIPKAGDTSGAGAASAEIAVGKGQKGEKARRRALRANGWDRTSINDLITLPDDYEMASSFGFDGSEAEFKARHAQLQARLEAMPSCLKDGKGGATPSEQ